MIILLIQNKIKVKIKISLKDFIFDFGLECYLKQLAIVVQFYCFLIHLLSIVVNY